MELVRVVHVPVLVHCPANNNFLRDVLAGACSGFLIWFLFWRSKR